MSARRLTLLRVVAIVGFVGLRDRRRPGSGSRRDCAVFSALEAHRGTDACMQLSPALRRTVTEEQSASGCAEAVGKVKSRESAIVVVHVNATSARVDLAGGQSVFLSSMRDGWRIGALGCRPRSSGPFDCEGAGLMRSVRVMFVLYLALIVAGRAYAIMLGILEH